MSAGVRRVVHVVASIDDKAAGPSISVPRLAEAQARSGLDVELSTVARGETGECIVGDSVSHRRHPQSLARIPVLNRLAISAAMRADLVRRASQIDVVHTHGLWSMPNVYPAAVRGLFVISPRGMLGIEALAFSRRKKRIFWALAQGRAARSAGLFHSTSEAEAAEIRAFGLTAPIAVVPNGIDLPQLSDPVPATDRRTVLSLGRIHPKKGLRDLVVAWSQLLPETRIGWRLRIVGPSELGHADELKALAGALGIAEEVAVEGPLFGDDKLQAYRAASLFVLPTLNENFAMTVAEALAAGTPVIATKGAPWAGLQRKSCGLWVDRGASSLAAALTCLIALGDEERKAMGARGRAWMACEFSWDGVARMLAEAYRWAVEGGLPPTFIRLAEGTAGQGERHEGARTPAQLVGL